MTRCEKCGRPLAPPGYTLGTHCGPLQETTCDQIAKAYRRGYRDCLAMVKEHAEAYAIGIDWSVVDAKAKEVIDG